MTAKYPKTNARSESTTWTHEPDRIRRSRREGQQERPPQASFKGLSRRNPRERLTIQVTYRGGAEGWWLIEARGTRQAFPGSLDLHTVMTAVNQSWRLDRGRP